MKRKCNKYTVFFHKNAFLTFSCSYDQRFYIYGLTSARKSRSSYFCEKYRRGLHQVCPVSETNVFALHCPDAEWCHVIACPHRRHWQDKLSCLVLSASAVWTSYQFSESIWACHSRQNNNSSVRFSCTVLVYCWHWCHGRSKVVKRGQYIVMILKYRGILRTVS